MILLILGVILLVVAIVNAVIGQGTAALITGVIGLVLILIWIFRRWGRRGDFSRSGSTGQ